MTVETNTEKPWTPQTLSYYRKNAGFPSQRKLAQKTGVDQQTISRIEAGGTISQGTAEKIGRALGVEPPALFIAHNVALIAYDLSRGRHSLSQAKRNRNYIEDMLAKTENLNPHHYAICHVTLAKLNEIIEELHQIRHVHIEDWPGAADVDEEIADAPSDFSSGGVLPEGSL